MKKATFRKKEIIMKRVGHGQYTINGYHYTDSTVYDNLDSENKKDAMDAKRAAYYFLKYNAK